MLASHFAMSWCDNSRMHFCAQPFKNLCHAVQVITVYVQIQRNNLMQAQDLSVLGRVRAAHCKQKMYLFWLTVEDYTCDFALHFLLSRPQFKIL